MRPAGIFAPNATPCFTKPAAYEKGNQHITPVKGKSNKSLTKQNNVRHGQNTTNKPFNFSKQSDYKLLKLTTMKKQIFFLFFMLFASITAVVAQPGLTGNPSCPTATVVTCLSPDALHPVPGNPYTYEVLVPTPGTGTKTYNWFVTQDQNFIAGSTLTTLIEANDGSGDHIQATGAGYNNTPPGSGTNTISITWKSFTHDPTQPVFLVIYVTNSDCATDNIKVYMIQPMHAFTLDIANLATDGTAPGTDYPVCVAPVASATYDQATTSVLMDYGVNYTFYAVTAANFTDSWLPSFQPGGPGLRDTRVITAIEWAYPDDAVNNINWHATTDNSGTWTSVDAVEVQASGSNTVGQDGECIVIRMTIENNRVETLVAENITIAVDGVMLDPVNNNYTNSTAFGDIHHDENPVGNVCPWYDGFANDVATQVLSPRPAIQAVTPTPFVNTDSQ